MRDFKFIRDFLFRKKSQVTAIQSIQESPTQSEIELQVREIVALVTGDDLNNIALASPVGRYASSNDAIAILMRCEEVFKVEIPDKDAEQFFTIEMLVKYIASQIEKNSN